MKQPARPSGGPAPELPMDIADAAGGFGVLAGLLSAALPYFLGLTVALSIVGAGVGLVRLSGPAAHGPTGPWTAVGAWGPLGIGWIFFLSVEGPAVVARGVVLGASAVPLWLLSRRTRPFGGLP